MAATDNNSIIKDLVTELINAHGRRFDDLKDSILAHAEADANAHALIQQEVRLLDDKIDNLSNRIPDRNKEKIYRILIRTFSVSMWLLIIGALAYFGGVIGWENISNAILNLGNAKDIIA